MVRLFVDLEETLIESSDTGILMPDNISRFQRFVDKLQPESIETFSWGLWTSGEMERWEQTRGLIKEQWGLKINTQTFGVAEQQLAFLRSNIGHVEANELSDFCGLLRKELVFEWFVRNKFESGIFVLVDDKVPNKTIQIGGLVIEMRNIASL
jgi:hypothetical protein